MDTKKKKEKGIKYSFDKFCLLLQGSEGLYVQYVIAGRVMFSALVK